MEKRWFGLIGVFAALYLFSSSGVLAAGLTIQPVKASYTLNPGESVSGVITLTNAGEEIVNVEIKVEDFVPAAGGEGVKFVGRAPGVSTVRDWVTINGPASITLNKGEARNISYKIMAPENAEPGSHFGVAFFKATKIEDEGQFKIGTQVGVLLFVTVPGNQLQKGKILDFSVPKFVQRGPVVFKTKFENEGTVHFEPRGSIKITNILGKEVGDILVAGQVVLPTGVKELTSRWDVEGFLLGRYKAEAVILDGEGNTLTSEKAVFYAFPAWYIAGFLILLVAVFFLLRFAKERLHISISVKK